MGEDLKQYDVLLADGTTQRVYAGDHPTFTPTGDVIFEDSRREFQVAFGKGFWLSISEIKVGN